MVDVWFYEDEWSWNFKYTLLDWKYEPKPFERVGEMSSTRTLLLQKSDLICESKGGSVGEEGITLNATYL